MNKKKWEIMFQTSCELCDKDDEQDEENFNLEFPDGECRTICQQCDEENGYKTEVLHKLLTEERRNKNESKIYNNTYSL